MSDTQQDRLRRFMELQAATASAPRPAVLVVRHSIRGRIPLDPQLRDVPLKAEGEALCTRLGQACTLHFAQARSSPMQRCSETARIFLEGAGCKALVRKDRKLGAPGAFIADADKAWDDYLTWRKQELVRKLYGSPEQLHGYRAQAHGVHALAEALLPSPEQGVDEPSHRLGFACTHDILMSATLSWLANRSWADADWPDFHEGFCMWREGERVHAWYRGERFSRSLEPGPA